MKGLTEFKKVNLKEFGNSNFNMDPDDKKVMVAALVICTISELVNKAMEHRYSLKGSFHVGDKHADIELSPPDSPVE